MPPVHLFAKLQVRSVDATGKADSDADDTGRFEVALACSRSSFVAATSDPLIKALEFSPTMMRYAPHAMASGIRIRTNERKSRVTLMGLTSKFGVHGTAGGIASRSVDPVTVFRR
jgi:hypothetical protein